ncbi:hypothetical protein F5887DRAFT_1156950 [Amanita rubescens]|nr:hypothetical protein F5887DRAFT_1156950 [Amanita rubescens]
MITQVPITVITLWKIPKQEISDGIRYYIVMDKWTRTSPLKRLKAGPGKPLLMHQRIIVDIPIGIIPSWSPFTRWAHGVSTTFTDANKNVKNIRAVHTDGQECEKWLRPQMRLLEMTKRSLETICSSRRARVRSPPVFFFWFPGARGYLYCEFSRCQSTLPDGAAATPEYADTTQEPVAEGEDSGGHKISKHPGTSDNAGSLGLSGWFPP